MWRFKTRAVQICILNFAFCIFLSSAQAQPSPQYEVYAVRYATAKDFPVAALVAGADRSRKMDIAMVVWVLRGNGHTILFDSGFYRDKFLQQWKPVDFVRPSDAIAKLGIKPEDVTDV